MSGLRATAEDHIIRFDPALDDILAPTAEIKLLAKGFVWSEGPAWDKKRKRLYFSDVPENKAYVWSPEDGVAVFLDPSGHPGESRKGFREPGSNGLLMASDDQLLIANHGARAVEIYSLLTGRRETLTGRYQGRRLNSPNDIALAPDGTLYFTDPPYGLEGIDASPLKEQPHNGVYALGETADPVLVDDELSFPNGLAVSPDGTLLYVAVSDPASPTIYRYTKAAQGSDVTDADVPQFAGREVFFDASSYLAKGWPGLPDGMAVASSGHIFATGPGGVFILAPNGKALGLIRLDRPTANCAFGLDGKTLFITSADRLLSINTLATGANWRD